MKRERINFLMKVLAIAMIILLVIPLLALYASF